MARYGACIPSGPHSSVPSYCASRRQSGAGLLSRFLVSSDFKFIVKIVPKIPSTGNASVPMQKEYSAKLVSIKAADRSEHASKERLVKLKEQRKKGSSLSPKPRMRTLEKEEGMILKWV